MSSFRLRHDGPATELSPGWSLRVPGASGAGEFALTPRGERRAADSAPLVDLEPGSPAAKQRRAGVVGAADVAELDVPPPPDGHAQVVLETGPGGIVHWHIHAETVAPDTRRGTGTVQRFRIPLRAGTPPAQPNERRGLFSAITRRVLKVLVFPITDFVIGELGKGIARVWESHHAPYGARAFDSTNFQRGDVPTFVDADWRRMAAGRALLFVHGTFSTAHHGFGGLAPRTLDTLAERFGGRVFAFNHWTLSHDPHENAKRFVESIPGDLALDVDIVCHSRGGLVSRALAAGPQGVVAGAGRLKVGRIVFVATPNGGTALADATHMVALLDRYTNVVQFLPDGPVEVVMEAVVTAVKTLAHAGLAHLPGLAAQAPGSAYLARLGAQPLGDTSLYAIAADFEPDDNSPFLDLVKEKVADTVMDTVFEKAKNDLVVPTLGVAGATGAGFPIAATQSYTFAPDAGAIHTTLFRFQKTGDCLLDWLPAPAVVAAGG